MRMEVGDNQLIKWFRRNYYKIAFVRGLKYDAFEKRKERLGTAVAKLNPDIPLHEQKDVVLEIWRNLIGIAVVYLKSQDGREAYHDEEDIGVERLHSFFKAFNEFESLLYGAGERYRDHVSHVFRVFLLGQYVITKTIGFAAVDVGDQALLKDNKIGAGEKQAMRSVISLTHDLGMAPEKIPEISRKAKAMLQHFGIGGTQELSFELPGPHLQDLMIRVISSDLRSIGFSRSDFATHLQSKYYLKFSEALERRDHGVVSCLVLLKNLVYFLETDFLLDDLKPLDADDAKQFLVRRVILRSIASHNCENIYHLRLHNFPFLLVVFDDMQEWGRPRFADLFSSRAPDTTVILEKLSKTHIHYRVEFSLKDGPSPPSSQELTKLSEDVRTYFKLKCQKIIRLLRSAVGGKDRNLNLTFEVSDKIDPTRPRLYGIVHPRPDKVEFKEDNQPVTWQQLISTNR